MQSLEQNANEKVESLTDSINNELNSVLDISNNISQSQIIIDMLKKGPPDKMEDVIDNYDFIQKYFRAFTEYGRSSTRNIRIYPLDENFLPGIHISDLERLKGKDMLGALDSLKPFESLWTYTDDSNGKYVALYRKIFDDKKTLGYLEIEIPFYWIVSHIEGISLSDGEEIIYTAKNGLVLYGEKDSKSKIEEFEGLLINGDKVSLNVRKIYMLKSYFIFAFFSILIFAAVLCAVYFLYKMLIYNITKELHEFINELNKDETSLLETNFDDDESSDKDIKQIKMKFRNLILKIGRMHKDIEKINNDKKKIELEYLQMSFNPHMLYNSLSAISWMLRKNGNNDMVDLVEHMTSYYRAVLSGGSNIITIREEINLIRQYLAVVETSYKRTVVLSVECEDELLDYWVIKQLLQPIVENAVLHGAKGLKYATISINVKKENNDILFTVLNTGYAMTDDEIKKAMLGKTENIGHRSYGILNTINRIKTYYGNEYGLEIRGIPGVGTEVKIKIECLDENTLKYRM